MELLLNNPGEVGSPMARHPEITTIETTKMMLNKWVNIFNNNNTWKVL